MKFKTKGDPHTPTSPDLSPHLSKRHHLSSPSNVHIEIVSRIIMAREVVTLRTSWEASFVFICDEGLLLVIFALSSE